MVYIYYTDGIYAIYPIKMVSYIDGIYPMVYILYISYDISYIENGNYSFNLSFNFIS